jgi:hypothetical protein
MLDKLPPLSGLSNSIKNNDAININDNIKGNNTRNQDIYEKPDLHIIFNNQVQNKIYIILIIKINVVLETLQE